MTRCPECKTPMQDFPAWGWRQCPECGTVRDLGPQQPKTPTPFYREFLREYFNGR